MSSTVVFVEQKKLFSLAYGSTKLIQMVICFKLSVTQTVNVISARIMKIQNTFRPAAQIPTGFIFQDGSPPFV